MTSPTRTPALVRFRETLRSAGCRLGNTWEKSSASGAGRNAKIEVFVGTHGEVVLVSSAWENDSSGHYCSSWDAYIPAAGANSVADTVDAVLRYLGSRRVPPPLPVLADAAAARRWAETTLKPERENLIERGMMRAAVQSLEDWAICVETYGSDYDTGEPDSALTVDDVLGRFMDNVHDMNEEDHAVLAESLFEPTT